MKPLAKKCTNSVNVESGWFFNAVARAFTLIEVLRCFVSHSAGYVGLWGQVFLAWALPQKEQECRSLSLERVQPKWLKLLYTILPAWYNI